MHIASYPKVYAIGHPGVLELFDGPVLIEEKVDGSQISFCRVGQDIFVRSRGADIYVDAPDKMFSAGVAAIKSLTDRLHEGWVYRGEYLQKPKHNTLVYDRIPRHNIILFDINTGEEAYLDRADKEAEAERIGMEIVPLIHDRVYVKTAADLLACLDRESVLGGQKIEGIVVKNYAQFGKDKKVLMGKYVREDFKERNSKEWRASNPSRGDVIDALCVEMRNERRWEKAVFHLRDRGDLENSPRDIGKLIAETKADIGQEERDYIAKRLLDYALPRILRASTAGLPEWYKQRLVDLAFGGEHDAENAR